MCHDLLGVGTHNRTPIHTIQRYHCVHEAAEEAYTGPLHILIQFIQPLIFSNTFVTCPSHGSCYGPRTPPSAGIVKLPAIYYIYISIREDEKYFGQPSGLLIVRG